MLLIFLSCARRERLNPIDPRNPQTKGRPAINRIYSVKDTVFISWEPIELEDLNSYKIYRKTSTEDAFNLFATVSSSITTFVDTSVTFGVDYQYRITAAGTTFESLPSEPVIITPGPSFNWVADTFNRNIVKLTHDSRYEILRARDFFNPIDLEFSPLNKIVWIVDLVRASRGEVVRMNTRGKTLGRLPFSTPFDLAVFNSTGEVWVADSEIDAVVKMDSTGTPEFSITSFSNPIALSIDQQNGDCWVADNQADAIVQIKNDGSSIFTVPFNFNAIQAVTVNSKEGSVWVADSTRIVKLDMKGKKIFELNGFNFVFKLVVNENTGEVWLLDLVLRFNKSKVVKLAPSGQKVFELSGFTVPEDLALNLYDNSCLVADTQNDRIVRISPDGNITAIFDRVFNPQAVTVQNN